MSGRIMVRAAMPADHGGIAALLDRQLGAHPRAAREALWRWRHDDNPARIDAIPGFLVAERDGTIVGAHGLLPLRFKVGDRVVTSACSCDFAADPAARGCGMQLKLRAMSPDLSPLALSTSANEAACRLTVALGGHEVAAARVKHVRPLRSAEFVRRRARARFGAAGARVAAGVAATLADPLLGLGRRLRPVPRLAGTAIEPVARFDARFDRLWERAAADYAVAVVRDAAYLDWRYGRYPFLGVTSLCLRTGDGVRGFVALHDTADEDGVRFTAILDLFTAVADLEAQESLLAAAVRHAADAGAHYVTAKLADPAARRLLERRGFLARTGERSPQTYRSALGPEADALLADPASWYVAQGDGDIAFFYGPPRAEAST